MSGDLVFGLLCLMALALWCGGSVMIEVERRLRWCKDCNQCQAKEREWQRQRRQSDLE